jgi:hypothetical protein
MILDMKKLFVIIMGIALSFTGCDISDFGDTNKNVNGPLEGNTSTLLSGAMTNFATRQGRPYRITPTLNVQYFMQLIYNDEMLYADYPGYWQSYYVQVLSNLKLVIDIVTDPESAVDPAVLGNGDLANQQAVAMIFKAVVFKRVTDLFGDVPYSNSLTAETLTPIYDKQEDIYADLFTQVKAARDMIKTGADGPTGDAIYGGDMTKWVKFANSFLMQMALQLSEVTSSKIDPEAEFAAALAHSGGVIETLDDEAWYLFDTQNGFNNPWNWMRPADYGVSEELISSLKGYGDNAVTSNTTFDNRILVMQEDTSEAGLPYGYKDYSTASASVASVLLSPGTSLPLLTAGYTWLNRAEAASRGWTAENVSDMLTNGIMASYASMEALYDPTGALSMGDGSAYAAARVADMTTAGELTVIGEEKWVALYPLGYDAWSEWRRTEVPALQPAADAINNGEIPRRYNYPSEEVTLNSTNYGAGVNSLSPATDNNTSLVWWNQ